MLCISEDKEDSDSDSTEADTEESADSTEKEADSESKWSSLRLQQKLWRYFSETIKQQEK